MRGSSEDDHRDIHVLRSPTRLQSLAYCVRPNLRATASDAALIQEVL